MDCEGDIIVSFHNVIKVVQKTAEQKYHLIEFAIPKLSSL